MKYRNSDQKFMDQVYDEAGLRRAVEAILWEKKVLEFLKTHINCDCETGCMCQRCALIEEAPELAR